MCSVGGSPRAAQHSFSFVRVRLVSLRIPSPHESIPVWQTLDCQTLAAVLQVPNYPQHCKKKKKSSSRTIRNQRNLYYYYRISTVTRYDKFAGWVSQVARLSIDQDLWRLFDCSWTCQSRRFDRFEQAVDRSGRKLAGDGTMTSSAVPSGIRYVEISRVVLCIVELRSDSEEHSTDVHTLHSWSCSCSESSVGFTRLVVMRRRDRPASIWSSKASRESSDQYRYFGRATGEGKRRDRSCACVLWLAYFSRGRRRGMMRGGRRWSSARVKSVKITRRRDGRWNSVAVGRRLVYRWLARDTPAPEVLKCPVACRLDEAFRRWRSFSPPLMPLSSFIRPLHLVR